MRSRLVACLLTLATLLVTSTAGRADTRSMEMAGIRLSWDSSQLPDARWNVAGGFEPPSFFDTGSGLIFHGGGPLIISLTAMTLTATLDPTNFHLDAGAPQFLPLPDGTRLRITSEPRALYIQSESLLRAPEHAQLAVSLGRSQLSARFEGGADDVASSGSLLATRAGLLNTLSVVPSLAGVDPHALLDGVDLTLSAQVVGGYHLTSSPDPSCASLDCMVGQRASATLRRIDIVITTTYDIVSVSTVPEPSSWALWLLGAWAVGRRLKRRDDEGRPS